ncbi:MAG: ThuA domain-containing protein [Pedobacter sp.]|nr:MAG: ThuA domain-containing protein [Pedobacter sp.]
MLLCFFLLGFVVSLQSTAQSSLKGARVLLYTKNGKGFIHDNIPNAIKGIKGLAAANKFTVDVSEDPSIFTEENLKKYKLLVFANTNNDVFDNDQQRLAFRRYLQAGGGFVGVHSVTGTERNWTWFKQMIGGTFEWHAVNQKFRVKVIDPSHPSMKGLPKVWERSLGDECYFTKEMYPGIKVLIAHDLHSLAKDKDSVKVAKFSAQFKDLYPAAWYQKFDGANVWITTLGHNKEYYEEATFMKHILQGMEYIASQIGKIDYSKAYASTRDTEVQY